MKPYIYILFIICLLSCSKQQVVNEMMIVECASLPVARASATAFTLNDKAYICCGRTNERDGYLNDLWEYTSQTNQWVQLNDLPFAGRVKAASITVDNIAYIGMGFSGTVYDEDSYLRDWWAFDGTDWTRLSDFPSKYSNGIILFNEGQSIYACFGYYDYCKADIYRYDIDTDTWVKEDYSVSSNTRVSMGSVGQTHQGRHFVGTGYNADLKGVWSEFIPSENGKWVRRKQIPGKQRCLAAATTTDEGILVAGGRHWSGTADGLKLFDDIWCYLPEQNKWQLRGTLPIAAENMVAFTLDGKAYFGLGEDTSGNRLNTIYRLDRLDK